ncbi:hypothetical protein [Neobacillus drentensis]
MYLVPYERAEATGTGTGKISAGKWGEITWRKTLEELTDKQKKFVGK